MHDQHEATAEAIRTRAVQNGLDPERAANLGLRGAWVQELWTRLKDAIITTESDPLTVERVRSSKLQFNTSITFAAVTMLSQGHYSVNVNLGIVEAISECSLTIAGAIADPSISGHSSPSESAEEAGTRLAHVLGWLTSVARCAVSTPGHDLPAKGQNWARGVTVGSVLFVLAHELGHIIAGNDNKTAHESELLADSKALEILRTVASGQTLRSHASNTSPLLHIDLPTDLTVPAGALFLSFEGLRQRALGSAGQQGTTPSPRDLLEATQTKTHPSPYERLLLLRAAAACADSDGSEAASIDAIQSGFDLLLPVVHRNMPEWVIDEAEFKQWASNAGVDPARVPAGLSMTFESIYLELVVSILRQASRRGQILTTDLTELSEMAMRNPRTVINTLALARTGQLLPLEDPDSQGIYAMGRVVAEQILPLVLHYAVNADPSSVARLNLPNLL